ncbi:MAG: hypothetical protein RIG84_03515 [Roseovarius sp.]
MSFIRPEARAALWRFREALTGAAAMALGLWWVIGPGGLLTYIGTAIALAGAALTVAGLQRARFRAGGGGPGVVRVDEGQIAYFGPLTGGVVALSEIEELALDGAARPGHWLLSQPGQPELAIPLNAEGAEALFDVFASLPGIRTERLLSAMRRPAPGRTPLWQRRKTAQPERIRLH